MKQEEKYKLKKIIGQLEKIRGKGTELISVYIPDCYQISLMAQQLSYEKSQATNIKSKTTRKNVLTALEKILQEMKNYKQTPERGMIIFCGNTGGEKTNMEMQVLQPPEPLKIKLYRCDQIFHLEPLKEMIEDKEEILMLSIDKSETAIGLLKGKQVIPVHAKESNIPGKFRAGGQSAQRFLRQRQQLTLEFLKEVGSKVQEVMRTKKLKKIIIGGPGFMKEEINDEKYLGIYAKNVIGLVDTGYAGEGAGFEEILEKAGDLLKEEGIKSEKEQVNKFLKMLAKTPERTVYGYEQTKKLLEKNIIQELVISEKLDEKMEEIIEIAEKTKTEIHVISTETREGKTLWELGGIGGILKYAYQE